MLAKLTLLDGKADSVGLPKEEWESRYNVEESLEKILSMEEILWKQKGGKTLIKIEDNNIRFFHLLANRRRRKNLILYMKTDQGKIRYQAEIREHIYDLYKKPFWF